MSCMFPLLGFSRELDRLKHASAKRESLLIIGAAGAGKTALIQTAIAQLPNPREIVAIIATISRGFGSCAIAVWINAVLPAPAAPMISKDSRFAEACFSRSSSLENPSSGNMQLIGNALLHDQHTARRNPGEILRRASPEVFVNPRMSVKANDKQIKATLGGKVHDGLDLMARNNRGFEGDVVQRGPARCLSSELAEVAVFRILLLVDLHHGFGVARYVLLHANHVQLCFKLGCEFDRHVESFLGPI